jgi:Protein of unknown function (DUF4229)
MTEPNEPPKTDVPTPGRHPALVYTGLRLLIFVVPFVLLLAVQVPVVWALLISALLSSFASLFVLSKYRDRLSVSISQRRDRMNQRIAEREATEDAWDEGQRATTDEPDPGELDRDD